MTLKTIAVIPARGGSKGVPRKNVLPIGGVSLIARSVRAAQGAARVDAVFVSTDDPEIADAARAEGATVIDRPASIAGDTASSEAALLHALDVLNADGVSPERLVFLQCTSPFTTSQEIDDCAAALDDPGVDATFAAASDHGFYWGIGDDGRAVGVNHDERQPRKRRQELPPQYRETGSIYAMRVEPFRAAGHRFCGRVVLTAVETPPVEIDTLQDFAICDAMAGAMGR